MSRPEHLHCINTREGITRTNEDQACYDKDPEGYERREREAEEYRRQEEMAMREDYDKQQNDREDISFNATTDCDEIPF